MTNALELLKASATTQPVGGKGAVEVFLGKIDQQKAHVKELQADKKVNTRLLWFRKQGTEYVVRAGRSGLEIAGAKFFSAKDLDGVATLFDAMKAAIEQDKALQEAIVKAAATRTDKLRAGRAKKKAK